MQRTPEPMRHIPEEELHAYLDQALSRSQCVEIEHHLSSCLPCRADRDAIAALRDRTTALLVAATPRRIRPRPYTQISATLLERNARRARRFRHAAWAASLAAAVGLGWGIGEWTSAAAPEVGQPVATAQPLIAVPPTGRPAPVAANPNRVASATNRPARNTTATLVQPAVDVAPPEVTPLPRTASSTLSSIGGTTAATDPVLNGLWRTVNWNDPPAERDQWLPRVEGVPVVQVKMRQAPAGGRPLTLVTQQLANGEMISTVEGPATEVAELLKQQPGQSASAELQDMQATPRDPVMVAGQPQPSTSAPRTLAIFGSAPSDSLKAFMLRVK